MDFNANKREIEEEEKSRFVRSILEAIDVPLDFWGPEDVLSVEGKMRLRSVLNSLDIEIIDDRDGGLIVYADKEKIAEWFKCEYVLRQDPSAINPRKRVFLEMQVNFWSIFENN